MLYQDSVTGEWKDDGTRTRVDTPLERQLATPDDVAPGDLVAGVVPNQVMPGRFGTAKDQVFSTSLGTVPRIPYTPAQPAAEAPAAPATAPLDTPLPSQPVTVPKPAGGGGGGGGPGLGTGPTAEQAVARGGVKTANEQERDVLMRERDQRAAKADDEAALDIVHKERERHLQEQIDQRTTQLNADLKAKQDVLAKDRIHDMFEGRPLAAIVAALSSGFGAFAATRSGGVNHAQVILDNAAQMFRQKEMHRIEQEEKGVEGSRTDITHAETRADASMAQLYRTFARDRETVLRKRGYTDEMIAGDKLIAQNVTKGAEIDAKNADQNAQIARQEVNDRAQRAAQGASANASNAQADKTRAETTVIQGGGAPGGGQGRAFGKQADLAIYGQQVKGDLDKMEKVNLSPQELQDGLRKIQDNENAMKVGSEGHGAGDVLKTAIGRTVGLVPRSRMEGLSARQQQFFQAHDVATKKVGTVLAGQGHANATEIMQRVAIQPGDDPETVAQKVHMMRNISDQAIALAQKPGQIAAAATTPEPAAAAPAAGKLPPLTPAQRVKTEQWIKQNPSDPRVARAKARLME